MRSQLFEMNKFKTMKYKSSVESFKDIGLFDKLSKYSTVRFLRKGGTGNTSLGSSQKLSARYNMTGRESDDHKLEIGAPILISKTTIDADAIHQVCDASTARSSDHSDEFVDAQSSVGNRSSFGETNDTEEVRAAAADDQTPSLITDDVHLGKFKCSRSKSASNLHKAELNLYLIRNSSTEIDRIRSVSNQNVDKITGSVPTNYYNDHTVSKRDTNKSYRQSQESVTLNASTFYDDLDDEFDLKSASFQSLNARNSFLSIEELNDITKQINESEEFKWTDEIDNEYCAHRDTKPPTERRIILLREKSSPKLFGAKKEKLTNAWSDFKSWIDEERGKIKEVVNKHAAAHRVNANKSADVKKPATINDTSGNIVQNADFFNHIQLNSGEIFYSNANCSNADTGEHGNRCIVEGGSDDHPNQMNTLLSIASMNAKGKNIRDHLVEVKFKANE